MDDIDHILREKQFNLELKTEQKEVIKYVVERKDSMAVLPTGFGKSMCYILPPLILDKHEPTKRHTSLVVSPLKSLIRDQVDELRKHEIMAYGILEGMEKEEIEAVRNGLATVVFAPPEAVLKKHWRDAFQTFKEQICVVAYDEAHCISEWGLDFRPDYQKVGILQSLLDSPVLVLSATLTSSIRTDIDKVLGLQPSETSIVAVIPDRPNIFLHFFKSTEKYEEELVWIMETVKKRQDKCPKMIIYVNSIAMCETLYIWFHSELKKDAYIKGEMTIANRMVEMYHAHTDDTTKLRIMNEFVSKDSHIRVLIATVACGMGVNIPDISIAILWGLPPSLLQMWQMIGRCGRDGRSSIAICYGYARSVSMPCDRCRKERKFQCKCNDREYLRSAVTVEQEHCQRVHCLKHFLLEGMDAAKIAKLEKKEKCLKSCETVCNCSFCTCCVSCIQSCKCSASVDLKNILNRYLKE